MAHQLPGKLHQSPKDANGLMPNRLPATMKTSFDPKRLWNQASLYMQCEMNLLHSLDCAVSSLRMGQHQASNFISYETIEMLVHQYP